MKNKGLWKLLGFSLFILGITALVLQLVGISWAFLALIEMPGRLFAFVFKIVLIVSGAVIVVLANTDWERERRESEQP